MEEGLSMRTGPQKVTGPRRMGRNMGWKGRAPPQCPLWPGPAQILYSTKLKGLAWPQPL